MNLINRLVECFGPQSGASLEKLCNVAQLLRDIVFTYRKDTANPENTSVLKPLYDQMLWYGHPHNHTDTVTPHMQHMAYARILGHEMSFHGVVLLGSFHIPLMSVASPQSRCSSPMSWHPAAAISNVACKCSTICLACLRSSYLRLINI
jgi:hypothetical protein